MREYDVGGWGTWQVVRVMVNLGVRISAMDKARSSAELRTLKIMKKRTRSSTLKNEVL